MDSYSHVDNFQSLFVKIPVKFGMKKERRKFDRLWKTRFLQEKLVWRECLVLAEFKNVIGFTLQRPWVERRRRQVGSFAGVLND